MITIKSFLELMLVIPEVNIPKDQMPRCMACRASFLPDYFKEGFTAYLEDTGLLRCQMCHTQSKKPFHMKTYLKAIALKHPSDILTDMPTTVKTVHPDRPFITVRPWPEGGGRDLYIATCMWPKADRDPSSWDRTNSTREAMDFVQAQIDAIDWAQKEDLAYHDTLTEEQIVNLDKGSLTQYAINNMSGIETASGIKCPSCKKIMLMGQTCANCGYMDEITVIPPTLVKNMGKESDNGK